MTQEELNKALAASPSPDRITPDVMTARIASVTFLGPDITASTLTLCILKLDTGFTVTGESACADPANYNREIGEKIAYDNAFNKLWPLFGFALKEAMHARDLQAVNPVSPGWARYTSTKHVECAEITAAEFFENGAGRVAIASGEIVATPEGFQRKPGAVLDAIEQRGGAVLVRYTDGYLSWLPMDKFQEPGAYTLESA